MNSQFYNKKIKSILDRCYTQNSEYEIFTYKVDREAYLKAKDFELDIKKNANDDHCKSLRFFLDKLHGTATRIAGIIHTWNHEKPEEIPISADEMELGIQIAALHVDHAVFAYSPSGSGAYYDAGKILDWVRSHNKLRFTVREIGQGKYKMTNDKIYPALDLLEEHNYLRQINYPGRSTICVMHPRFR